MPDIPAAELLVVDDSADIRRFLEMALSMAGYRIALAANGRQALQQIGQHPPHLMLLDLEMPVMSGQAVLVAVRSLKLDLPIICMSAGTNAAAEAIALGAQAYLAKPFDLEQMLDLVARLLGTGEDGAVIAEQGGAHTQKPMVAILNSNDDLLELLRRIVEAAGYATVTAHAHEVGRTVAAVQRFLRRHEPAVILFDVSPPYLLNWTLLRDLEAAEVALGSGSHFVVTTPNRGALERAVGPTAAIELIGTAEDEAAIGDAIRQALAV